MMLGWAISAAEATLAALLIAIGMGAAQRRVMTVLACVVASVGFGATIVCAMAFVVAQ